MGLGLKPMGKLTSSINPIVLDGTNALRGPRTQAFGETNYFSKFHRYPTSKGKQNARYIKFIKGTQQESYSNI